MVSIRALPNHMSRRENTDKTLVNFVIENNCSDSSDIRTTVDDVWFHRNCNFSYHESLFWPGDLPCFEGAVPSMSLCRVVGDLQDLGG